ncbi:DUF4160 domain-containing protein [Photorhabdus thracensis]|nr:DUF4160 domain-containing protein [Photorhabdus thracensis]
MYYDDHNPLHFHAYYDEHTENILKKPISCTDQYLIHKNKSLKIS